MPYNQQMRALDQQPNLAKLAEMLQSTRSAGNQYSVPDWVPLVGGSGVGDMFLGKSPEEIENWSYGNAPMQVPEMSRVPQFKKGRAQSLADTAMLLSGPAESTARNAAAGNVGMIIKPKGGNWLNNAGININSFLGGHSEDVSIPVQDWAQKKLGSYIRNEMGTLEDPIRRIAEEWPAKQEKLLTSQLNKRDKLQDLISKYEIEPVPAGVDNPEAWRAARLRTSQRDLEDVEDEIGRIKDYNPLHYKVPELPDYTRDVKDKRVEAGYPEEGIAKSDLAKRWEYYTDQRIHPETIGSVKKRFIESYLNDQPYLKNAPDDTVVYNLRSGKTSLYNIADRLNDATSDFKFKGTPLPEELRIAPEKLNRMSVPQAVEHAAKINDWVAQQEILERSRNPAIVEHKQYPEHGMSLVELKLPPKYEGDYFDLMNGPEDFDKLQLIEEDAHRKATSEGLDPESDDYRFRVDELAQDMFHKQHRKNILKDALKYEGEQMNNCVGGYCDDVSSGSSRVFSIRDRKGEPHVTIETSPIKEDLYYNMLMNKLSLDERAKLTVDANDYNVANPHLGYRESVMNLMKERYGPPKERIVQIKGKQNTAPDKKYLPAVHDFVRSKDWLIVGDLENTLLTDLNESGNKMHPELYKAATDKYGRFVTDDELNSLRDEFYERNKDIPIKGFANGGLVGTPPTMYDPMKVDDIVASIDAPHNYAEGGSVDKDSLQLDKPQRTPSHPTKSHIVKTMVDGKEKIIRFGEQGAETAGKPKEGESDRMTAKRESFKARHAKNIAKGKSSAAYWADKVKWADGGSVSMKDLPFNDPDQLRLYHQAMQHFDDLMENTGGSKKMGKTEARVNYNKTTKGDRDRDKDLHTLIAEYGVDLGDSGLNLNAAMIKPIEAEGVYLGNLSGSVPVGEGRASLGLQGLHTKYSDGLSGYTAGYTGKVGDGNLSANYFEPADHKSEGRQVQLEYNMPFSKGGSVTSEQEDLYHRAMAHYDNLMAA